MLNELHIENIAVIERADISFAPGLNVLTGETGAGKSIVIDAIGAVLGDRVSRELVRSGADKAVVTASFDLCAELESFLRDNDIDAEDELILQRRIGADGKSSCRVCGVPVSAVQLKELSSLLVDIHGQNDGRQLMDERRHLSYLDRFGVPERLREDFSAAYGRFSATRDRIDSLRLDEEEKERLRDRLSYRIEELEKAGLKKGEYEEIETRLALLRNSEKLTEAIDNACSLLYDGDENAVSLAQNAANYAQRAASYAPELESSVKAVRDAVFSLTDAAETLRDLREQVRARGGELMVIYIDIDRETAKHRLLKRLKEDPAAAIRTPKVYNDIDAFLDEQNLLIPEGATITNADHFFVFHASQPEQSFEELKGYLNIANGNAYNTEIAKERFMEAVEPHTIKETELVSQA